MRENGRKYVRQNYDWNVILEKIRGMIESLEPVCKEEEEQEPEL